MDQSIEQYVYCKSDCTLRYVESLAMIGVLKNVEILDCGKPKFKKIKAYLVNDTHIESLCYFEEEISQALKIINTYMKFAQYR